MFESYTRKGVTTRQISGIEKQDEDNCLELTEMVIKAGKIKKNKKTVVPGTVEEMAAKHQMGIDSINYFLSLINQIIPTKKDIIAEMLSEDLIKDKGLTVLFPSLIKTENYHKGLK